MALIFFFLCKYFKKYLCGDLNQFYSTWHVFIQKYMNFHKIAGVLDSVRQSEY